MVTRKFASLIPILLTWSIGVVDISIDIYLPTMPLLVHSFSTYEEIGALTVSIYLLASCISGLIYGPLSDAIGRRKVFLVGMAIFSFFSICCPFAHDTFSLLLYRAFQGFGAGCAWILSLAIIKDIYTKRESVRILSKISLVVSLSPAIAPILGSYIGEMYGWKANFYIIAILAIPVFILLIYALPETLSPQLNPVPLSIKTVLKNYLTLICNKNFISYTSIYSIALSAIFIYITIAPFFYIKELKMSMYEYGSHQLILLVFNILGTILNRYYATHIGMKSALVLGLIISFVSSMSLTGALLFCQESPFLITGFIALYIIGLTFIFSNTSIQAMDTLPHMGGASASILSSLSLLCSALMTWVAGEIYVKNFLPISYLILGLTALSCMLYFVCAKNAKDFL